MDTRASKYSTNESKPSRVEKNKDLYKMIYSAYDEFENYKVPLEEKEIDLSNVKKSITSRDEYMKLKKIGEFTNSKIVSREDYHEESKSQDDEVYDIKELLDKVKNDNPSERKTEIREERYLDKLHLKNDVKTNLEKLKEEYEDVRLDQDEEEKLSNTANLSLEILSDLKSSEDTVVTPPMKDDDSDEEDDIPFKKELIKEEKVTKKKVMDEDEQDDSFYSDIYKFKKKDFESDDSDEEDDEDDLDEESEEGNKFLFRILIIISLIILMGLIAIYVIGYFSK